MSKFKQAIRQDELDAVAMTVLGHLVGEWSTPTDAAVVAYDYAEALLAERAKRYGKEEEK